MNRFNNNRILELADLQKTLLAVCTNLNRPIRKSKLIKMATELFECNTPKQVEFALISLLEQGRLREQAYFIVTPEFYLTWDGQATAADEKIIKFLLSLKEEVKHDAFFHVYAKEVLTPHIFFKYVQMKYPALLCRDNTPFAYMEQMEQIFTYNLNNDFYAEFNDYPTYRWFTKFFSNNDRRIFIKSMDTSKNHVYIQLALLSGKKGSYRKAYQDFTEFAEHFPAYFNQNMHIHIKKSLTTFTGGRKYNH